MFAHLTAGVTPGFLTIVGSYRLYTDFWCKKHLLKGFISLSVCLSVCLSVTLPLQICKMQKNTREKVHIVLARDILTFLCVEMCLKILDIDSERDISTFNLFFFKFHHVSLLASLSLAVLFLYVYIIPPKPGDSYFQNRILRIWNWPYCGYALWTFLQAIDVNWS